MDRDELLESLAAIAIIAFTSIDSYIMGLDWEAIKNYWSYSPNAYRLFEQFLIWLETVTSISIKWYVILSWVICISITYLILKPKHFESVLFLLWVIWIAEWGNISNGPMYLILALIVKYADRKETPLLLIPLVFVKEVGAFIGIIYLFFIEQRKEDAVIWGVIAATMYTAVRFIIIGPIPAYGDVYPGSAPSITIFFVWEKLTTVSTSFILLRVIPSIGLLTYTISYGYFKSKHFKQELLLWILTAIPIFIFALFYEPQLWFPTLVVILFMRTRKEKIETDQSNEGKRESRHESG